MTQHDPDWIAPRDGQDWRDDDILRATSWLRSLVPSNDIERRIDAARTHLLNTREAWQKGINSPLYDASDSIAWYILQSESLSVDRQHWIPEETSRIVPFMRRLGTELHRLKSIAGAEDRAERIMKSDRGQPDGGLFELFVALAYDRHGWQVGFVPEQPGVSKTPDLSVSKGRRRWAVECKRLIPSSYAKREKIHGVSLAQAVHDMSLELDRSLIVEVEYKVELSSIDNAYLVTRVRKTIEDGQESWCDDVSEGSIRDVDWRLPRKLLKDDDIYFGSSRMVELLAGEFLEGTDYSVAARWRPSPSRPFYAEAVYQASVVAWTSVSGAAISQKSKHFRSIIAKAEKQLPADVLGAIHIGFESRFGNDIDAIRHLRNEAEAKQFVPANSRLRWVYANYFVPELTTNKNEAWAMVETTVPYKIGKHYTKRPLSEYSLVVPEENFRAGVHWDGLSDA